MLNQTEKKNLIESKYNNELLLKFFPDNFYSIYKFDQNKTKENKLSKLMNISRDVEDSGCVFQSKIKKNIYYIYLFSNFYYVL